jgi:hypothetical protein
MGAVFIGLWPVDVGDLRTSEGCGMEEGSKNEVGRSKERKSGMKKKLKMTT